MSFFSIITDAQAIVHQRGIYRQVAVYQRNGKVYARFGSGFVRLSQGGATSHPNVRWAEFDPGEGTYREDGGYVLWQAPIAEAAE